MKVMKMDEENVVIFMPIQNASVDFSSKDVLEDYFRKLFLKLEAQYDLDMSGLYQIEIYKYFRYGVIFDIEIEDVPYFNYLDHQIEMSIHIVKEPLFLYQVDDLLNIEEKILKNSKIYQHKNKFFIQLGKRISNKDHIKLSELGILVYGKEAKTILKFGKQLFYNLC